MSRRTTITVDDEGYGEIVIGGLRCGVMPLWKIPAHDMDRVTQGGMTSDEIKQVGAIKNAVAVYEPYIREHCGIINVHIPHLWQNDHGNHECTGRVW